MRGPLEGFFSRHRKGATLAIFVLVSFICLLVSTKTFVVRPKEIGMSVGAFFQKGFSGFFQWFGDTAGSIRQLREAREELQAANTRLEQLDQETREVLELRRQNAALREQLDFAQTLPPERIAAEVIARDSDNLFSTITINKGSRQGAEVRVVGPGLGQGIDRALPGVVLSAGRSRQPFLRLFQRTGSLGRVARAGELLRQRLQLLGRRLA